jgi:hypothetical protein
LYCCGSNAETVFKNNGEAPPGGGASPGSTVYLNDSRCTVAHEN